MDQQDLLMELEEAFDRLTWGLNAIELMALGLGQARDPYAGGFQAIWLYLRDVDGEIQKLLNSVSAAGRTA